MNLGKLRLSRQSWEKSLLVCWGAAGVENMVGPICSELVHLYTIIIMGGSHVRFSKRLIGSGPVQVATRAVAAPMLSISFNSLEYCSNSLSDALIVLYLSIYNTIEI